MATNWTDYVPFTPADIFLPKVLSGVTGTTNYVDQVKADLERFIKEEWHGVGKLTETDNDDFDIEEIENPEVLNASALEWNYVWIARQNATNYLDPEDSFGVYLSTRESWVEKRLNMDIRQLTFAKPEGINQLSSFSIDITR